MKKNGFIQLAIGAILLIIGFLFPTIMEDLLFEMVSESGEGGVLGWVFFGMLWFVASGVLLSLALRNLFSPRGTAFLMIPGWAVFGFSYLILCVYGIVGSSLFGRWVLEESGAAGYKVLYVMLLIAGLGLTAFSFISVFMGGSRSSTSTSTSTSWHLVEPVKSTTIRHSSIPSNFCENCGSPIVGGNRFCGVCGTPVRGERAVPTPAPAPTPVETYRPVESYTSTEKYEGPRTEEAPKSRLKSTFRK